MEAKDLVRRIDSTLFTRKEYAEIVDVVRDNTRRSCKIRPEPTLYRNQFRRLHRPYRHYPYWSHHPVFVPVGDVQLFVSEA